MTRFLAVLTLLTFAPAALGQDVSDKPEIIKVTTPSSLWVPGKGEMPVPSGSLIFWPSAAEQLDSEFSRRGEAEVRLKAENAALRKTLEKTEAPALSLRTALLILGTGAALGAGAVLLSK